MKLRWCDWIIFSCLAEASQSKPRGSTSLMSLTLKLGFDLYRHVVTSCVNYGVNYTSIFNLINLTNSENQFLVCKGSSNTELRLAHFVGFSSLFNRFPLYLNSGQTSKKEIGLLAEALKEFFSICNVLGSFQPMLYSVNPHQGRYTYVRVPAYHIV